MDIIHILIHIHSNVLSNVFCLHVVFNTGGLSAHALAQQLLLTLHMQSNPIT